MKRAEVVGAKEVVSRVACLGSEMSFVRAEASFHDLPKCHAKGPKWLFQRGTKSPNVAEVAETRFK